LTVARRSIVLGLVLAALAGCAPRRPIDAVPDEAPTFGVYAATHRSSEGRRSFRVLLHAELPDRIHAEVIGPVGGPRLIVDGGSGRLAVTFVAERTAYVGAARPQDLEAVFGVRITLADLVSGLLTGRASDGPYSFRRSASPDGLPASIEVASADGDRLELRLKRLRPMVAGQSLASGTPPPGIERRPLAELAGADGVALLAREPAD
jgi:hypothetical protein